MVIPNFHPHIAKHINWGENRDIAEQLSKSLSITLPDDITVFPACSMFWYRPEALAKLTSHSWNKTDFPEETGQIDGTIMHALERMLCFYTQQQGYEVEFSQNITLI
jgi:lipopolysaccharide biosynthesis protein